MDFEKWSLFAACGFERAVRDGDAILSYDLLTIERMVKRAREGEIGGHRVPVVNATHLHSELLEVLAIGKPFAASWWQREDGLFQYSLRSAPDGLDVSAVAKLYDGGGHVHAAGFSSNRLVHCEPAVTLTFEAQVSGRCATIRLPGKVIRIRGAEWTEESR